MNSARKFSGDFVNFQKNSKISRRKNYSSRFPGFPGVLDTRHALSNTGRKKIKATTKPRISRLL